MASIVIGSKSDIFCLKKTTWQCMTELESDVLIEVEEFSFLLHKFPLINASTVLAKIITKFSVEGRDCAFALDDTPGGAQSFEHIVKFCYGEKIVITSSNVVSILCAAYKLDMNDNCLNGNLIFQTENFLTDQIISSWKESLVALLSCEPVLRYAEEFDILSKCLDSLASKVMYGKSSYPESETSWNGIVCRKDAKDLSGAVLEWWHDDICSLSLYLFKRFIEVLNAKGHDPVDISRAVIYYASNHRIRTDPNSTGDWSADERILLEEIVDMLPKEKGATSTKVLLSMLSASIMLNANETCIETLEKRVGAQLDEATVEDLLVLNSGGGKAVRNVDCIKRLIKQFMEDNAHENEITLDAKNECLMEAHSLQRSKIVVVAKLVDGYLAKIAEDSNLTLQQFVSLASAIPRSARPSGDDLYHAISAYLEYHPQLSDGQKEQLCQLIDVQKLSRDLCRDVAQNENLPIRVIVKALFCEMLDLKKALVDCGDGNNTVTEAENTTEDEVEVESTDEKVLTESKGTLSRIWYRERRWYRLLSSERDERPKETKETEKTRERRWHWFLSSEHECPKETKESEKARGEKVMCQFLMSKNIWSVRRVKSLLAPSKQ